MKIYREHTEIYSVKSRNGRASPADVDVWLSAIARRYSGQPQRFVRKIKRIMNDAIAPSETLSPEHNLYRLSTAMNLRTLE